MLSRRCCGIPRGLVFPPGPRRACMAATGGFPPAAGPVEAGSSSWRTRRKGGAMASDISLAVGDGARRMTYAVLAAVRGISPASAKRLAQRHHWGRQLGNDGVTRVTVPLSALVEPAETKGIDVTDDNDMSPATGATVPVTRVDVTSDVIDDITGDVAPSVAPVIAALAGAVEALRGQLEIANGRAGRAEQRIEELQRRIDGLYTDLADARTAAMITSCEAAALRAENALLKARPWWRRWLR